MHRIVKLLVAGADVEKKHPEGKKPRDLINRGLWYRLPNGLLGEDGETLFPNLSDTATSSSVKCTIE